MVIFGLHVVHRGNRPFHKDTKVIKTYFAYSFLKFIYTNTYQYVPARIYIFYLSQTMGTPEIYVKSVTPIQDGGQKAPPLPVFHL